MDENRTLKALDIETASLREKAGYCRNVQVWTVRGYIIAVLAVLGVAVSGDLQNQALSTVFHVAGLGLLPLGVAVSRSVWTLWEVRRRYEGQLKYLARVLSLSDQGQPFSWDEYEEEKSRLRGSRLPLGLKEPWVENIFYILLLSISGCVALWMLY